MNDTTTLTREIFLGVERFFNRSSVPPTRAYHEKVDYNVSIVYKFIFGGIAVVSILGNLLLFVVICQRRSLVTKTYNMLLLTLAITDMLTGIFLVVTPDYVIDRKTFPYPSGLAGEIFCRLIGSTYILFIFSKASTSTIMCLAIDRWYSIVKPIRYKTAFSKRRLYLYITLIWASAAITQINELFIATVEDGLCTFITPFYGEKAERIFILIHVIITFYIPSIVTWVTFGHIWLHMRQPNIRRHLNNNKATKRLLRMCALAAFFLTISWLPAETFFILYKFEILKLPFEFYLFTSILAMSNSCFNPWIYCLSNREYRKEFVRLLCCINPNGPRTTRKWFGFILKPRSRNSPCSFSPNQTSASNYPVNDGAYVLRLRAITDDFSCNSVTSCSNIGCSEDSNVQGSPRSLVIPRLIHSNTRHL